LVSENTLAKGGEESDSEGGVKMDKPLWQENVAQIICKTDGQH
jgi:hypothetical protein